DAASGGAWPAAWGWVASGAGAAGRRGAGAACGWRGTAGGGASAVLAVHLWGALAPGGALGGFNNSSMVCPRCTKQSVIVYDTRQINGYRRRWRRCRACSYRWATVELPIAVFRELDAARASMDTSIAAMQQVRRLLDGVVLNEADEQEEAA